MDVGFGNQKMFGSLARLSQWCSGNPKPSMYGCQQNIYSNFWPGMVREMVMTCGIPCVVLKKKSHRSFQAGLVGSVDESQLESQVWFMKKISAGCKVLQ